MKVLIYCPAFTGHFSTYIRYLLKSPNLLGLTHELYLLTSEKFIETHPDISGLAESIQTPVVKFITLSLQEEHLINKYKPSGISRTLSAFKEWRILGKYLNLYEIDHCIIMYLDSLCLPILFAKKSGSKLSGIYYKPISHYKKYFSEKPSFRRKAWILREKIFLHTVTTSKRFRSIFCLDPLAVEHFNEICRDKKMVYLPDPVPKVETAALSYIISDGFKDDLKIGSDRKVFLLFGSLCPRKGVFKVIESFLELPEESCKKICLLIVGRPKSIEIEKKIKSLCEKVLKEKPVQIICCFEFISDLEISKYFNVSNVVLTLYQKQLGMSGVLLLAAAHSKPVFSSSYGLIGELVKRYQLGLSVNSISTTEISKGFIHFLEVETTQTFDQKKMRQLVLENSVDSFTRTFFYHL